VKRKHLNPYPPISGALPRGSAPFSLCVLSVTVCVVAHGLAGGPAVTFPLTVCTVGINCIISICGPLRGRLFFGGGGTRDWTHGCTLARQVPYHLSHPLVLFLLLVCFSDREGLMFVPGLALNSQSS
jgi:hypothetical protein